jgi:hypothetical protein
LLLTGVFDEAPVGAAYPYVSMGETALTAGDLKDTTGASTRFDLYVYSDEASQMQVKELMASVEKAVDTADISLPGFDLVTMRLVSANVTRQWSEAGSLYRGRLSYGALIYSA